MARAFAPGDHGLNKIIKPAPPYLICQARHDVDLATRVALSLLYPLPGSCTTASVICGIVASAGHSCAGTYAYSSALCVETGDLKGLCQQAAAWPYIEY